MKSSPVSSPPPQRCAHCDATLDGDEGASALWEIFVSWEPVGWVPEERFCADCRGGHAFMSLVAAAVLLIVGFVVLVAIYL